MKGLCGNCPARDTCTKLCPVALAFVKKHVGRQELLIGDVDVGVQKQDDWPGVLHKTKKNRILEMYFVDRERQADIAYQLGTSRSYVSRVIRLGRGKIMRLIS